MGIRERKERERERRRQQIMVAAKRVFTEKGFSKATMEDIAKEAELSPGTLYLYFKNKDELYASLSLRILQYLMIRLEHVNAEPYVDATQRLDALKDAMFDVYEFDPLILINMSMAEKEVVSTSEAEIAVHWQEEDYYYPSTEFIAQANMTDKSIYERFSLDNFPNCFKEYADLLEWYKYWDEILDTSDAPCFKWFKGGLINALQLHRPPSGQEQKQNRHSLCPGTTRKRPINTSATRSFMSA
jgi:AcrR family transcriptional regulator